MFPDSATLKVPQIFTLEQGGHRRTMFYGGRYLIDFPRTLGTLLVMDETAYQTLIFDKALKKQHYCKVSSSKYGPPLAEVLTWDDFEVFVQELSFSALSLTDSSSVVVETPSSSPDLPRADSS